MGPRGKEQQDYTVFHYGGEFAVFPLAGLNSPKQSSPEKKMVLDSRELHFLR